MMSIHFSQISQSLESIRRVTPETGEHWVGRELMTVFGYTRWPVFLKVIQKAARVCEAIGDTGGDHFRVRAKKIIPNVSQQKVDDYVLDRYACYLIAQNADYSKPEIAAMKTYLALQSRRQEIMAAYTLSDSQTSWHQQMVEIDKPQNAEAPPMELQPYALFQAAGCLDLQNMGLADVEILKNQR